MGYHAEFSCCKLNVKGPKSFVLYVGCAAKVGERDGSCKFLVTKFGHRAKFGGGRSKDRAYVES